VVSVLPWTPKSHPLHGRSIDDAYRHLVGKYLRLRPHLAEAVDRFYAEHLAGRPSLAVHARGTDKMFEQSTLGKVNAAYPPLIEHYLERFPEARILLLTDDETIASEYRQRYGERLVLTPSTRTSGAK